MIVPGSAPGLGGRDHTANELRDTTLDGDRPWAGRAIAVVKVDAETMEADVLRGAVALLERDRHRSCSRSWAALAKTSSSYGPVWATSTSGWAPTS